MSCRRHSSIAACTTSLPCGSRLRSLRTIVLLQVRLFAHRCDGLPAIWPCWARGKYSAWTHEHRHRRYVPREASKRRAEATMGLIELVLTVCALASPDQCEEQHLHFTA